MGFLVSLFTIMFSIFPAWFALAVLGFLAFSLIVIVIKIVAFVLDAIPFL